MASDIAVGGSTLGPLLCDVGSRPGNESSSRHSEHNVAFNRVGRGDNQKKLNN